MSFGTYQRWFTYVAFACLATLFIGCGQVPNEPPPQPPAAKETPATWRALQSAEPFIGFHEPRRLVLPTAVSLRKMTDSESDVFSYLFKDNSPKHYAFFVDGKQVAKSADIPNWTLFCGVLSTDERNSGIVLAKENVLALSKDAALSMQMSSGEGMLPHQEQRRSLVYRIRKLTATKNSESGPLWTGNFLCGVYTDRIISTKETKDTLKRAKQLLWGESGDAASLLRTLGKAMRYEIFAKQPQTASTD